MKRYFCTFALLLTASTCSLAQGRLLPDGFAGWQPGSTLSVKEHPSPGNWLVMWPRSAAAEALDSHPEYTQLLKESGVVRVEEYYYHKGSEEIAIRVFKLRDPSSAYEVYTSRLKTGMIATNLGQVSAFNADQVLLQIGNLVLGSTANVSKDDLSVIVRAVEPTSGKAPLPPIPNYLPKEGLAPGSERYALGPVAFRYAAGDLGRTEFAALSDEVGFTTGAEAMLAKYEAPNNQEAVLLLIDYPTPQLAEQHLRHLEWAIPADAKQAGTTVERRGSLLSLVLKPSSTAFGESLRNAIRYETQVTWNEPTHKITDPPWLVIVGRIITLTMLFMGLAVAVGAAFGGVRVLLKRFFPGRIFDRPGQMEVLQLGLTGKRFDPRDFY